jgi:hypothetical protein
VSERVPLTGGERGRGSAEGVGLVSLCMVDIVIYKLYILGTITLYFYLIYLLVSFKDTK